MTPSIPRTEAWQALADHFRHMEKQTLAGLFAVDADRADRHALETGPLYLDYSKNFLIDDTLKLFERLLNDSQLDKAIEDLYSGRVVNISENRPALHVALRDDPSSGTYDNHITGAIQKQLARMAELHAGLSQGRWPGFTNQTLDTIVNIGIGGSDLGPRLLCNALAQKSGLKFHFAANLDSADLDGVLAQCEPGKTLFIISSKSFTTLETRRNYAAAQRWLQAAGCDLDRMSRHFIAATANPEAARESGIRDDNIFQFPEWVGGRYSVWSSASLSAYLAVGPEQYSRFLSGARLIDRHFASSPWLYNMPVILAIISIWYTNYYGCQNHIIVPYDQLLALLPDYLCQLVMESNGKSVTRQGEPVGWHTAPATWGSVGSNAQHSFFQALHQGTHLMPVDFMASLSGADQEPDLLLSCLAQSRALMYGNDHEEPWRRNPGNRPSNTLLYDQLDAESLGAILALYEHKTFVQAHLWGINPFDQWGVELGKNTLRMLLQQLDGEASGDLDSSTLALLRRQGQRAKQR